MNWGNSQEALHCNQLNFPKHCSTLGQRSFTYKRVTIWNELENYQIYEALKASNRKHIKAGTHTCMYVVHVLMACVASAKGKGKAGRLRDERKTEEGDTFLRSKSPSSVIPF